MSWHVTCADGRKFVAASVATLELLLATLTNIVKVRVDEDGATKAVFEGEKLPEYIESVLS